MPTAAPVSSAFAGCVGTATSVTVASMAAAPVTFAITAFRIISPPNLAATRSPRAERARNSRRIQRVGERRARFTLHLSGIAGFEGRLLAGREGSPKPGCQLNLSLTLLDFL